MELMQVKSNGDLLLRMVSASSLRPRYCIDSSAANIRERASKLTAPHRHVRAKARAIFDFVRDEIFYNFAPDVKDRSDFRASHTLEMGNGFCMQKAALFSALCRASGIPARIGFQDIIDYKITGRFLELMQTNHLTHHGMSAIYIDGRWLRADCTLNRGLVHRKNYRLVAFDGRHDALLPKTDHAGKPHFTILKQSAFYNDTPWFAMQSMLKWIKTMEYSRWRRLVHGKDGSM